MRVARKGEGYGDSARARMLGEGGIAIVEMVATRGEREDLSDCGYAENYEDCEDEGAWVSRTLIRAQNIGTGCG